MTARHIMIQGTSSGAGKSTITAALCRILSDFGYTVAPFKSQNMSRHSYHIRDLEISSAQAVQAAAARCNITTHLNPILLKPIKGAMTSEVYVNGRLYDVMDSVTYYNNFVLTDGLKVASESLSSLSAMYDVVVLEGAGSPVEINLVKYDIANMKMAHMVNDAAVILVCDIERGGAFAALAGTMQLLPDKDARLVKGFVFNKFRGDESILKPGYDTLYNITNVPTLGTVPVLDDLTGIPDEDSLDARDDAPRWSTGDVPSYVEQGLHTLAKNVKAHLEIDQILEMIT